MLSLFPFLALAFMVGMVTPWQTLVNSKIRAQLDSPLLASCVNCLVGAMLLLCLMLVTGQSFYRDPALLTSLPWWFYISGPLGAAMLVAALVLLPRLGMVGTTVAMMSGMLIFGLTCDHWALFGLTRAPFSLLRALGLFLVVIGILTALQVLSRLHEHALRLNGSLIIWFILGSLAGACGTLQAAVNALLRVAIGSMLYCALFSMVITALLTLLLALCSGQSVRRLRKLHVRGQLINYSGGVMGVINIACNALLLPHIGAGALSTLIIAGQLVCSMLLDHFGVGNLPRRRVNRHKILGIVLILLGLCCIRLL